MVEEVGGKMVAGRNGADGRHTGAPHEPAPFHRRPPGHCVCDAAPPPMERLAAVYNPNPSAWACPVSSLCLDGRLAGTPASAATCHHHHPLRPVCMHSLTPPPDCRSASASRHPRTVRTCLPELVAHMDAAARFQPLNRLRIRVRSDPPLGQPDFKGEVE